MDTQTRNDTNAAMVLANVCIQPAGKRRRPRQRSPPTPSIEGEGHEIAGTSPSSARRDLEKTKMTPGPEMPTCVSPEHVHACSHGASLKGNHAKSSEARSRRTDTDRQATCSCCSRLGPAYMFSHTPRRARRTGAAWTMANRHSPDFDVQPGNARRAGQTGTRRTGAVQRITATLGRGSRAHLQDVGQGTC
jgi:hypothetical protein